MTNGAAEIRVGTIWLGNYDRHDEESGKSFGSREGGY